MEFLKSFVFNFYDLFIDMSFYIVIGLIFTGILHVYIKKEWITKQIGKKGLDSVVKSSVIGVPLPLCSCGVVPTAIQLGKSGASKGAVTSFLTSTPQTGVDSLIATYGMMGGFFAVFRAVAAFVSGVVTGIFTDMFINDEKVNDVKSSCGCSSDKKEVKSSSCCETVASSCCSKEVVEEKTSCCSSIKTSCCSSSEQPKKKGFLDIFRYAFGEFLDDISWNFVVGLFVATIITTLIPTSALQGFANPLITMLLMLVVGIPMYVCSTSSIPIAISLIAKGISPGSAFVFLFTGPVTNIASIGILIKALGKKTVAIYIASVSICAIAFGLLLDYLVVRWDINIVSNTSNRISESLLMPIVGWIFAVILINSLIKRFRKR